MFTASDPEKGQHRGVIYAVAPSFVDTSLIWAGTDDGLIHVTRDAGKTWRNVTPPALTPWSKVSVLEASHFDARVAYAAINRFRLDDLAAHIYRTRDGGKSWQRITRGLPDNAPVNVVREDPERRGLLFAGTETSVHVSFDDGDTWQPLQLLLPHTSMRDLHIHGDDLIVATHGRSFWILDDIVPLRQLSSQVAHSDVHLFTPQPAYRIRWNRNTDTPLPPDEPAGKNPPDGAILDYYLQSASSGPVTLEILAADGRLVRRFSSTDPPDSAETIAREITAPTYWVRPTQILSAAAGMHRFVWDLRHPPPDALEHEYPIAAIVHDTPKLPLGPAALPGRYMVRLTAGERRLTQPLLVTMDPRSKASLADLTRQFEMEAGCVQGMNETFAALAQGPSCRAQLEDRAAKTGKGRLAADIAALGKRVAVLQGTSREAFFGLPPSGIEPENLSTLHQHFARLLGVVDNADGLPTSQAQKVYEELQSALVSLLARWNHLTKTDLPALNAMLEKAGLTPVSVESGPRP